LPKKSIREVPQIVSDVERLDVWADAPPMAEKYRVADGRRADAIDDNPSVDRWVCAVAPVVYPITVVAYRYGTRSLRLGLRKANASVAGCRFEHRSRCRYGLGAATYPAVELNVQLSEEPL
jgi:hypothetical protein